ncbi:unnamed protein product [Closterium sp. Yama58-4]|nr:unnamed protein product [Closterium sp. Yama58-4]
MGSGMWGMFSRQVDSGWSGHSGESGRRAGGSGRRVGRGGGREEEHVEGELEEEEEEKEVWILVSVKDTGIGISAEKQGEIFHNFVQADTSYTRDYGGIGLGLSIVQSLVHMMGGEVWVESDLGKGSTFFFTARLETAPAGTTAPAHPPQAFDPSAPPSLAASSSSLSTPFLLNFPRGFPLLDTGLRSLDLILL